MQLSVGIWMLVFLTPKLRERGRNVSDHLVDFGCFGVTILLPLVLAGQSKIQKLLYISTGKAKNELT